MISPTSSDVQAEAETLGNCHFRIKIRVSFARVQAERDRAVQAAGSSLKVPGFRPGKAPVSVLRTMLGEGVLKEEREQVLSAVLPEALLGTGLTPLRTLDFNSEDIALPAFGDLEFEIEMETPPEVELPSWKDLLVAPESTDPQDEQVEAGLQALGQDHPRFDPTEDVLSEKNLALCDVLFRLEDEDGPTAEGIRLGLQHPLFGADPEAFRTAMADAKANEQRTVSVKFQEGFEKSEWVGKSGEAVLNIKQVEIPRPATSEEIVSDLQMESVDELRDKIHESLTLRNKDLESQRQVGEALRLAYELHPFELPARLLAEEKEHALTAAAQRLQREGMDEGEAKIKVESEREALAQRAEQGLRVWFLMRRIASQEKVAVQAKDMEHAYQAMAAQRGGNPAEIQKFYRENHLEDRLSSDILDDLVRATIAQRLAEARDSSDSKKAEDPSEVELEASEG